MNTKLIFLYTAHHTGTWFLIKFLKEHPDIKKFFLMKEFVEVDDWFDCDKIALHNHVHLNRPDLYKEWNRVPILFTNHYYNDALVSAYPTIVPTRDPLLSLITRHKRHDDWSHEFIIEAFCHLATLADHPNVNLMPLDLMTSESHKVSAFKELCEHCHIEFGEYAINYAKSWEAQNTKPDKLNFKKMYAERDVDGLRKVLGKNYTQLEQKVDILRPFLEKLGYKDLIWW